MTGRKMSGTPGLFDNNMDHTTKDESRSKYKQQIVLLMSSACNNLQNQADITRNSIPTD
jgi:hypothetical protein